MKMELQIFKNNESARCAVALIDARGVATEVGIAALHFPSSQCLLSQIADSQTYVKTIHKLNILDPSEIILSSTYIEPSKSKLYQILVENFPSCNFVKIERKAFNDVNGLACIKRFGVEDGKEALILEISNKYYSLSATSALMKYIENNCNILFVNHSIKFAYCGCEGTMMIDFYTAQNLELILNLIQGKNGKSLYNSLNITNTQMGDLARLLRMNILQPLTDLETINTRLESVEELLKNEELSQSITEVIKETQDIDKLISSFIQLPKKPNSKSIEQNINNVIILKHTLKQISNLKNLMQNCRNDLLVAIKQNFESESLNLLEIRILKVINEDVTFQKNPLGLRNQRCYAVKAGFNGFLDIARQTYRETLSDMYSLIEQYKEKYAINLKIQYSTLSGFYITCPLTQKTLPDIFINIVKKSKNLIFTTIEVLSINDRIKECVTELYLMSDKIIWDLVFDVRKHISFLFRISESIGMLDMIASFSNLALTNNYVKPEWTGTLAIKDARHPILELEVENFIPNDIYACDRSSFQIITGPNMSGKSTYIRQIALMTIMAQRCFVPAVYASFRLTDQIMTRICNESKNHDDTSSFMMEMKEMSYILQHVTDNSIILIDELGRGTSTQDGLGITFAISEKLIESKAFIFFVTHFIELTNSLDIYDNVVNMHLGVEVDEVDNHLAMRYLYKVQYGSTGTKNYGIMLAKQLGFNDDVINHAKNVASTLQRIIKENREKSSSSKEFQEAKAFVHLAKRLIQTKKCSNLESTSLFELLYSIYKDC